MIESYMLGIASAVVGVWLYGKFEKRKDAKSTPSKQLTWTITWHDGSTEEYKAAHLMSGPVGFFGGGGMYYKFFNDKPNFSYTNSCRRIPMGSVRDIG